MPGAELAGLPQCRICQVSLLNFLANLLIAHVWNRAISCHTLSSAHTVQVCWMAYRKYSAMTPGGMSKDLGLKLAGQSKGKKATTLFLVRI